MCIVSSFRVYKVLSHSLSYVILMPTLKQRYSGYCFFHFQDEKIWGLKKLSGIFTERQYKLVPGVKLMSFVSESSVLSIISIKPNIFSSSLPIWNNTFLKVPLIRLLCWASAGVNSNSLGRAIESELLPQVRLFFHLLWPNLGCECVCVCARAHARWLRSGV